MNWETISKEKYVEVAKNLCQDDGARYSLIWGLSSNESLLGDAQFYQFKSNAVALQTHKMKPLVFTDLREQEAKKLASLIENNESVKEVVGTKESVELLIDNLRSSHPGFPEMLMSQRIYKCSKVIPAKGDNRIIKATDVHLKLVKEWFRQFLIDTFIDENPAEKYVQELSESRIKEGEVYLLITDGTPVSMACTARPTNESITINGVFSPIERRGNGYASACTAKLTELMLKEYDYCTLYTDSTNPTSNKIYTKIGYEFICESLHYRLSA
jgi:predicted GNAT family acetyltransferase